MMMQIIETCCINEKQVAGAVHLGNAKRRSDGQSTLCPAGSGFPQMETPIARIYRRVVQAFAGTSGQGAGFMFEHEAPVPADVLSSGPAGRIDRRQQNLAVVSQLAGHATASSQSVLAEYDLQ